MLGGRGSGVRMASISASRRHLGALSAGRVTAALFLGLLSPFAGCRRLGELPTGSIESQPTALPATDEGLQDYAEKWGKRYDADPGEKVASINYARALRALGRNSQAVAVMESAAVKAPKDLDVLAAYGKALA